MPDDVGLADASTADTSSMTVHLNLLDGTLLVNRSPLARLPRECEAHVTYRRLFGEVCPPRNVISSGCDG